MPAPTSSSPSPQPGPRDLTELPPWARTLLKRPLVEIRRGLSWGYDAPSEDSSVMVMTAPSGKYVDVRFPLHSSSSAAEGRYNGVKKSDIFSGYATAGLSIAHMPLGTKTCPPYDCTIHVQWQHPIDSSREYATDSADMYLLSNGDVMEIGTMLVNGEARMFKEYWLAAKLERSTDPSFLVVETTSTLSERCEPNFVEQRNIKGMVIKIDNYCQGILHTDSEFWVERWQVSEEAKGEWIKDPRSNTLPSQEKLPCRWAIAESTKLGDCITLDGREWRVVEANKSV